MNKFKLGDDVYLEFKVLLGKTPATIIDTRGGLYRNDEYLCEFPCKSSGGKVSGLIQGGTIKSVGDYITKFKVHLADMGTREHAIPFRITKSVLGKKRIV